MNASRTVQETQELQRLVGLGCVGGRCDVLMSGLRDCRKWVLRQLLMWRLPLLGCTFWVCMGVKRL